MIADRHDRPEVARGRRVEIGEIDAEEIVRPQVSLATTGYVSAMKVFAFSVLSFGRTLASAPSSSAWFFGSLSGPESRVARTLGRRRQSPEDDVHAVAIGRDVDAEEPELTSVGGLVTGQRHAGIS